MARRRSIAPIRLRKREPGADEVLEAAQDGQIYRWDSGPNPNLLLLELVTGHDHFGLGFGVGAEGQDPGEREVRRRLVWDEVKVDLVKVHSQHRPGTRPWAWWKYEAKEPRRLVEGEDRSPSCSEQWFGVPDPRGGELYESEGAYLDRHGLLLPGEPSGPDVEAPHASTQYALDVLASPGDVHDPRRSLYITGQPVKWACQRHLDDLQSAHERGWYFSHRLADRRHQFNRFLRHFKGRWRGKVYWPETWQRFCQASIFGWVDQNGIRRYYEAYRRMARKQGKSMDAMGDGWYLATGDREAAPEVYVASPSKEQSKEFFATVIGFFNQSPVFQQIADWRAQEYEYRFQDLGKMRPHSADHKTKDGLSPSGVVFDELHAFKDGHLVNVFTSGMDAREQPLIDIITTPGFDPEGYAAGEDQRFLDILDPGNGAENDRAFAYIATLDEEDQKDIEKAAPDESVWPKCRPNQGVTSTADAVWREVRRNLGRAKEWAKTLVKTFGLWIRGDQSYINMFRWRGCARDAEDPSEWRSRRLKDLKGWRVTLGIDVGRRDDPASLCLWEPDKRVVIPWYWVPEGDLRERVERSGAPYDEWVRDGFLDAVPGLVVKDQAIKDRILWIMERCEVIAVGVDAQEATQLTAWLRQELGLGEIVHSISQGHAGLHEPSLELDAMVISQSFDHGNNPVLTWNAGNCVGKKDSSGRIIPQKASHERKIDGVAAFLDAIAVDLRTHEFGEVGVFL